MKTQTLLGHVIFRVSSFDALTQFKLNRVPVADQIIPSAACFGILEVNGRTWESRFLKARSPENHRKYPRSRPLNQSYLESGAGISILNLSELDAHVPDFLLPPQYSPSSIVVKDDFPSLLAAGERVC